MRLRILSDLHLEFATLAPPPVPADAVLLAGDIGLGTRGLSWARQHFPRTPILYVPGNHEYYGGRYQQILPALRHGARQADIHLLDGDEVTFEGVRFLGATLWTDFELYGASPAALHNAMDYARRSMSDFQVIGFEKGRFQPQHARHIHLEQVRWLTARLAEPAGGATVVITHHLPHRRSIHPKYEGNPLNPAFTSDLDRLVRAPVSLWVHGHTHDSCDYTVNGTRVVCNPRGYLPDDPNVAFDPALVVEV